MNARIVLLGLASLLLASGIPSSALAQTKPNAATVPEAIPGPPPDNGHVDLERIGRQRMMRAFTFKINSRIGRYLAAAMKAQETDPKEGLRLIARLNPKRLNPMERASVYRIEALLQYAAGNLDATIEGFRKVLAEEILPVGQDVSIRFNIAQLLAGLYHWDEAIVALNDWFRYTPESTPAAYYLLGIANYQLGHAQLAIVNTKMALATADEPKEGWLQLLAALYIQNGDYVNATPVFEQLVVRFPKKAYWVQLALIYGARDDYRASLAVQQVAYAQGLLTEDKELRRLARAYLFADLPYPAAKILEQGLADGLIEPQSASYELLANSWIQAREYEKSLPALKRAAKVAKDGNLYVRLGQVYLQREKWDLAAARFEDALDKGDLEQPGNAMLLRGIAYYNDNQSFRAKSSFIEAAKHQKTRKNAEQWLDHLAREANKNS